MASLSIWHWVVVVVVVLLLLVARNSGLPDAFRDDFRRAIGEASPDRRAGGVDQPPLPSLGRIDWYWPIVVAIGLLLLGFLLWKWMT